MARKKTTRRRPAATRGGTGSRNRTRSNTGRRLPGLSLDARKQSIVFGLVVMGFSFILLLSLASPNQGQLTAALSRTMRLAFGWGGVVLPFVLAGLGFYAVLWGMDQTPQLPRRRLIGLLLLVLVFEALASMLALALDPALPDAWAAAAAGTGGGYFGALLLLPFLATIGPIVTVLLLLVIGVAATTLLLGITREETQQGARWVWTRLRPDTPAGPSVPVGQREIPVNTGRSVRPRPSAAPLEAKQSNGRQATGEPETAAEPAAPQRRRQPKRELPPAGQPISRPAPIFTAPDPDQAPQPNWKLPVIAEMLEPGKDLDINDAFIREQVEIIEHTLESFGAPAVVVEINQGPTVTQFGVEPQFLVQRNGKRTKVKVGKIASLADDLALALAAHSVRVQAPVPGRGYVGLEIPNSKKTVVSLRDVMESGEFQRIRSPLRIGLGQNVAGQPAATDLAQMPHLLIAGATGSGKSVCVNSIITCLLLQNTPEDLRLVMVDPKRVELTNYNGIPHLVAPVVVDIERVIGTLQWALREMDSRYQRLAEMGARNILDYNKKAQARGTKKLPYIVIVIDELADLMMLSPEDTERAVTRLAQMARATGIHMVIATQRPSVDVVTGLIKANFPARIAFAVASSTDSRVILDTVGAERLLGQGDMLFQSPDASAPVRLQGCFLSDQETTRLIEYWRTARRFNLIRAEEGVTPAAPAASPPEEAPKEEKKQEEERIPAPLTTLPPPTQQPLWDDLIEDDEDTEFEDELYPEAVALVRQLNKASTSMLQRRFRIGYTRAARLMDIMEENGVIGPPTGTSKAREVINPEVKTEEESEEGD